MTCIRTFPVITNLLLVLTLAAWGRERAKPANDNPTKSHRQFTFSWIFAEGGAMATRGGTTIGADDFTLVTGPTSSWNALQESRLDVTERDRRAILAMAGAWRASFDFIETAGCVSDYEPARPYRSWGTEYVMRLKISQNLSVSSIYS